MRSGTVAVSRLGDRVRTLREERGLNKTDLATAAGISPGYVSKIEAGDAQNLGSMVLHRLAIALFTTYENLLAAQLDEESEDSQPNVVGRVEEMQAAGFQPLPVYRWGTCGDPRDENTAPDPDHMQQPPIGHESLVGRRGFGVMVKGDSMVGRGILDGSTVWVNPDMSIGPGRVVLANVVGTQGEDGMVVKLLVLEHGREQLVSHRANGVEPFFYREYTIIGRVVWIDPPGYPPGERPSFNYA